MTAPRPLALVTRPEGEAGRTVRALDARGWDALLAPVLEIRVLPGVRPEIGDAEGLLFTSAAGVRAWIALGGSLDRPVWTVGDATARAARGAGAARVVSAAGDAGDLVRLLIRDGGAGAGPLLHISGERVAVDVAGDLERAGVACRRLVVYAALIAERLPPDAVRALTRGIVRAAPIFSPRAAGAFVKLAAEAGALESLRRVDALFISDACARAGAADWRTSRVAAHPTEAALLDLLPVDATWTTTDEDDGPA